MCRVGLIEGMIGSCYQHKLYGKVLNQRLKHAIGYIVFLSIFLGTISGGALIYRIHYGLSQELSMLSQKNIPLQALLTIDENAMISGYITIALFVVLMKILSNLLFLFVVMGIGGLVLSIVLKLRKNYKACCKLGAYALTVPLILECLLNAIGIRLPGFFFVFMIIAFVYQSYGMLKGDSEDRYLSELV